jgi:predicted RNA binding protein YcfA (HicA-like mRNA interferase family)
LNLPVLDWKQVLKALRKKGSYAARQSGSHIIVENGEGLWTVIPRKRELGKGLLLQIIADCGLTKNEILELL